MTLNGGTFLKELDSIATGQGFKRTIAGIGVNSLTEADGDKLDNGSTPPMAALETNGYGVAVASSATDLGALNIVIPQDYDESLDELKILLLAATVGGTDSGDTFDCTAYNKRGGVALGSDLNPSVSGAIAATAALADWVTIDLSSNSLRGGDVLHIFLITSAHANDPIHVYGLEVQYRSTLVYFDLADRG